MESLHELSNTARLKGRRWRRIRNTITFFVLFVLLAWAGIYYYYPFAEGVKSGKLNYVVYKGFVFKTYEGKLIQSGIKPAVSGGVQSNEFEFSVANKQVAERLMHAGGKTVELHYTEYFGAIPWRGYSRYVVNEIVDITEDNDDGYADIDKVIEL
ncbi:MAG: hypothetical protein LBR18_06680 [Tannerella sp.]|jgi:hypothetical protein|nr:hypothetical protein [Tannerella sp.]